MFRFKPGAKLCQSVSIGNDTMRVEYLDGKIAEMLVGIPLPKKSREPAQISFTPIDKKFRRWVKKEITKLCDASIDKEDFHNRLTFIVDKMLKINRSVLIRLEKE
jgi:hypothetical protein